MAASRLTRRATRSSSHSRPRPRRWPAAAKRKQALAGAPLAVRIGIHTGTPYLTDEGYVGIRRPSGGADRRCGHGGQVLVSASTGALVGRDGLRDLGEHRLKDLSLPSGSIRLGDEELPAAAAASTRTNLPVASTPFVGRERELASGNAELLIAKRRALADADWAARDGKDAPCPAGRREAADSYPDGVFWVPLAASPRRELRSCSSGWRRRSASKRAISATTSQTGACLVLFDNFEQV